MSIKDRYDSYEHRNNLAHFSAIVNIALSDGQISPKEEESLRKFANKLDITDEEYKRVMKSPEKYPPYHANSREQRLERIFDLFKIIFADHHVDANEQKLIHKYAIGLGCTSEKAKVVVENSIKIFEGGLNFEDYQYLLDKLST